MLQKEIVVEKKDSPDSASTEGDAEEEPYDYSQDWSEYDWWGYDGVKKKRNEKQSLPSNRFSKTQLYGQRKTRKLGSMR